MGLRSKGLVRTIQIIFGLFLLFMCISAYIPALQAGMPAYSDSAMAFLMALFATGYMVILMQLIFVACAIMFIFNRWSAFGAVLLAPISVNILLFHVFLDMTGMVMALVFFVLNAYLLWVHGRRYAPMFAR